MLYWFVEIMMRNNIPIQVIESTIIDSAVVVDDKMDALISEIQELGKRIIELEKILDRQKLIDKAMKELLE